VYGLAGGRGIYEVGLLDFVQNVYSITFMLFSSDLILKVSANRC